jgi:hypothetical protein
MPNTPQQKRKRFTLDDTVLERRELPQSPLASLLSTESGSITSGLLDQVNAALDSLEKGNDRRYKEMLYKLDELRNLLVASRG